MRLLSKLIGLALVIVGVYFVGQNILFTTQISRYWWGDISAASSVICLILGIIGLVFFSRNTGNLGWILVILGIALVFISGGVILRPTSLWYFFLAFAAMISGFKLIRTGRIDF